MRPPKPKPSEPDAKPTTVARSFLLGAGGMATNVTTLALYVPALALIASSGLPLGQRALAGLIILLIALMVAWVPLLLTALIPGVEPAAAEAGRLDERQQSVDPVCPRLRVRHLAARERHTGPFEGCVNPSGRQHGLGPRSWSEGYS